MIIFELFEIDRHTNKAEAKRNLKKIFVKIALILAGLVIPVLIMEIGIRIDQRIRIERPFLDSPRDRWDSELGWLGKEHIIGSPVLPLHTLVIGDSFTEGMGIPGEQLWFAQIASMYPGERTVAYGGRGYGTLQELFILRRYLSREKPREILLQICSNDFINNYFPLEKLSLSQRAPAPRPYWVAGTIETRFPRSFDWIIEPLIAHFRLFNRLNLDWERMIAEKASKQEVHTVEDDINTKGYNFPLFRESVTVTDSLLRKFVQEADGIPVRLILVDNAAPYANAFKDIAVKLNVPLINPTRSRIFPPSLRMADGAHYNEEGNHLFGELARERLFAISPNKFESDR